MGIKTYFDADRGDEFLVFDNGTGELIRGVAWANLETKEYAQIYVANSFIRRSKRRADGRFSIRVVRGDFRVVPCNGEPENRAQYLERLIKKNGWTMIAEIGVAQGKTTSLLLSSCPNLKMIAVDCWPREFARMEKKFWQHVAPYQNRLQFIRADSAEGAKQVPDASLDAGFIDADHSEAACTKDIVAWLPKIRSGGLLCGHDYNWDPVKAAVLKTLGEPSEVFWPDALWIWWVK
jgi:predicted O-methyltransferase YrrM